MQTRPAPFAFFARAAENKKKSLYRAIFCRGTMAFRTIQAKLSGGNVPIFVRQSAVIFVAVLALALSVPMRGVAQAVRMPPAQPGQILGTVMDVNGDPVAGAKVVLAGPKLSDRRSLVTSPRGFFEFRHVKAAIPYRVIIRAIAKFVNTSLAPRFDCG